MLMLLFMVIPVNASFTFYTGKIEDAEMNIQPTMNGFTFASFKTPSYPNEYTNTQEDIENLAIFDKITGGIKVGAPSTNGGYKINSESDHKHTLANPYSSINIVLRKLKFIRPFVSSEDYIPVQINGRQVYRPMRRYILGDEFDYNFNFVIVKDEFYNKYSISYSIYTCSKDIHELSSGSLVRNVYRTRLKFIDGAYYIYKNEKGESTVTKKLCINEKGYLYNYRNIIDYKNFRVYRK